MLLGAAFSVVAVLSGNLERANSASCSLSQKLEALSSDDVALVFTQSLAYGPTLRGKFHMSQSRDGSILPRWTNTVLSRGARGIKELVKCTKDREKYRDFVFRNDIKHWFSLDWKMDANRLAVREVAIGGGRPDRFVTVLNSNPAPQFVPTVGDISWGLIGIITNREVVSLSGDFLGNAYVSAPSINASLCKELEASWAKKSEGEIRKKLEQQLEADILRPDSILRLQGAVERLLLFNRQLGCNTVLKVLRADNVYDRDAEGFYYHIGYRDPLFATIREKVVVLRAVSGIPDLKIDAWCRSSIVLYQERSVSRQDCEGLVHECERRLGRDK